MAEIPSKLVTESIDAWIADVSERPVTEIYQPIMQAEVISLACVWSLVRRLEERDQTVYHFASDVMGHTAARAVWDERALAQGDYLPEFPELPYKKKVEGLQSAVKEGLIPYRFELVALQDGRPDGQEFISGSEMSLIGMLSHAVYNSTNGNQLIVLNPMGPPANNPWAFLTSTGEHQIDFMHSAGIIATHPSR